MDFGGLETRLEERGKERKGKERELWELKRRGKRERDASCKQLGRARISQLSRLDCLEAVPAAYRVRCEVNSRVAMAMLSDEGAATRRPRCSSISFSLSSPRRDPNLFEVEIGLYKLISTGPPRLLSVSLAAKNLIRPPRLPSHSRSGSSRPCPFPRKLKLACRVAS